MNRYFVKMAALVQLYLADVFAYKAAAFIWVLSDLQVALVLPLVWKAVGGVGGMTPTQVTTYYIVVLTISQFVTCHLLWDIAVDIREGTFLSLLVRPFSHLSSSFARNIAWRTGKLILYLPIFGVMLLAYGLPEIGSLKLTWQFWLSVLLGQTMAFFAAYSVAMIALWTTEFVSLFQIYYFPEMLFSGRVVPLSAMPDWAQRLADWTHFKYTVGFPTEIALGHLDNVGILKGLEIQCAWLVFFYGLAHFLFRKGVRQYYGFGM